MKSITELILMFIKLFIVYKLALFTTRVIIKANKKGIQFICRKAGILLKRAFKKAIKIAKLVYNELKTKTEPETEPENTPEPEQ